MRPSADVVRMGPAYQRMPYAFDSAASRLCPQTVGVPPTSPEQEKVWANIDDLQAPGEQEGDLRRTYQPFDYAKDRREA
jgi:hypothetical protein